MSGRNIAARIKALNSCVHGVWIGQMHRTRLALLQNLRSLPVEHINISVPKPRSSRPTPKHTWNTVTDGQNPPPHIHFKLKEEVERPFSQPYYRIILNDVNSTEDALNALVMIPHAGRYLRKLTIANIASTFRKVTGKDQSEAAVHA